MESVLLKLERVKEIKRSLKTVKTQHTTRALELDLLKIGTPYPISTPVLANDLW